MKRIKSQPVDEVDSQSARKVTRSSKVQRRTPINTSAFRRILSEMTVAQLNALCLLEHSRLSVQEMKLIRTEARRRLRLLKSSAQESKDSEAKDAVIAKSLQFESVMPTGHSNATQSLPLSGKSVACQAFQQELPSLCCDPATRSHWVLYVRDQRSQIGETKQELIRVCNSQGLSPSEYFIGYVDEASADDFESGEINAWNSADISDEENAE